jgi:dTDP-4-amino-4,6-dideoxygalactose transaminase
MPISECHLSGNGAVAALEGRLRAFYGVRHALCVSSASMGLLAVGVALNLRRSDFVTTPYTYGATLSGWLLLGNRPVFADIDPHTLALDPESARQWITPRTKALLAVDIHGIPSDTAALRRLADEFNIPYIADAAQSFGALREGRPASVDADARVISFTVGKTLCAGEGGAILTNHDALFERLIWHTQHPQRQRRDLGLNFSNEFALNGRIHPLAAEQANAGFDAALARLHRHQAACFDAVKALNETECIEPIRFHEQGIVPTFFRLTAAWKSEPLNALPGWQIELPPGDLLYRHPAFIAQFKRRLRSVPECPVAEDQARRRFSVVRKLAAHRFNDCGDALAATTVGEHR